MDINQGNNMANETSMEEREKDKQEKKERSRYSPIVWFVAVLLLILILLTTALVFSILHGFTLREEPPRIEIDIEINVGLPSGEGSPWDTGTRPAETTTPGGITPPETTTGDTTPTETTTTDRDPDETTEFTRPYSTERSDETDQTTTTPRPAVEVADQVGTWEDVTVVELFRASYENNNGVFSVKSAFGDKVIAPGTANSYYFDIKNSGNIAVDYTVKTFAELTNQTTNETVQIPIMVRFYNKNGSYMLGSEDSYANMSEIDGLTQNGGLSVNHYVRYVLDWEWPFEGNDELDTALGNLAANGDEIRVALRLQVTATANRGASGGTRISK